MDAARRALLRCCVWLVPGTNAFLRAAILLAWAAVHPCAAAELALDRYVAAPDPAYAWKEANAIPAKGHTVHVIEMTSQRWLTERETP